MPSQMEAGTGTGTKMSDAANQGKRDSPETRARKSASAKAWRAKQRGLDAPEYPLEGDDDEN